MNIRKHFIVILLSCLFGHSIAGTYTNPILPYDYSDPDVCQVGNDYYMTASSFNCIPGLQILHSTDLVHWRIVDAALRDAVPGREGEDSPEYGCGVWAPSIRYHGGRFYIYYGDPDRGIYCIRSEESKSIPCHWEKAVLIKAGKGYIDPCPLWDEDGRAYLVHAFAGSRAGIKSILAVGEMSADGLSMKEESRIIFDGHPNDPTCEGPKFYKRNGYYYIFCPAGGVKTGWQLAMRSRNLYGPYEVKRVLEQGKSDINGPHQGAWIGNWFIHFQDVGVAGRIVHLQPLRWVEDWPIIGKEGEPVLSANNPLMSKDAHTEMATWRDEFEQTEIDLSWQWSGNRRTQYGYCNATESMLRLFSYPADSIASAPNLLLQKIPANQNFCVTAKVRFYPHPKTASHESAGLIVAGKKNHILEAPKNRQWIWLRVEVSNSQKCQFYVSEDGIRYRATGGSFQATEGAWIGAKIGLFCTRDKVKINDSGYMDVDFFEIRFNDAL